MTSKSDPAALSFCPATRWHFHWANSANTSRSGNRLIGPLGLEYKEADDDPRNAAQSNS